MICGCLVHYRDQPGALQVPGLKEAKPPGAYQEKIAHFKPRNNKNDCFLEWEKRNGTVWGIESWCKRRVLMLGSEGDA